jgi:hypothetical protein
VDETAVEYMEELERMNSINLGDNITPTLSPQEMIERSNKIT